MIGPLRVINAVLPGTLTASSETYLARSLSDIADVVTDVESFDSPNVSAALAESQVIVTGWGTQRIDSSVLALAPKLRCILHVGGTVKDLLAPEVWSKGIAVSSSVDANALPVAEYTLAMILMANKRILPIARRYRSERAFIDQAQLGVTGNYRRRIGIVGASRIGRRVVDLLAPFDLDVVLYDPTLTAAEIRDLGAEPSTLDALCATCDVVSVHAPALASTEGMISRTLIDSIAADATLINTSRGSIIDQDALVDRVLRGDLHAVLDVTTPWVLASDHPFYEHPNVLLTPHIAGSVGSEVDRMIDVQLAELRRFASGERLAHPVALSSLGTAA
ncbi:hydroxyacid dehydrogenase [Paramicrobacterium chengjingii]|uniref:Hydroxyacid dehydrogenase n=1 Tax=Paramicrobacterium chengjingii TaxID=2769067 RepID=A0ABX6YIU1_9MICO|nr:hydroxyacid dehydrogenase [Microbacterium chengjingii]QPZ38723.1 hydroxyacid dehydrogenase [Microbacterium chengjingii]